MPLAACTTSHGCDHFFIRPRNQLKLPRKLHPKVPHRVKSVVIYSLSSKVWFVRFSFSKVWFVRFAPCEVVKFLNSGSCLGREKIKGNL